MADKTDAIGTPTVVIRDAEHEMGQSRRESRFKFSTKLLTNLSPVVNINTQHNSMQLKSVNFLINYFAIGMESLESGLVSLVNRYIDVKLNFIELFFH